MDSRLFPFLTYSGRFKDDSGRFKDVIQRFININAKI